MAKHKPDHRPAATRNLVQCYSLRINKAATHTDRKKAQKAGFHKHRPDLTRGDAFFGA